MKDDLNKMISEAMPNQQSTNETIARLFDVAKPGAVFDEPVTSGEHTVITASEIVVTMGLGYGGGGAYGQEEEPGTGAGGGGGGGGFSSGRPVAAISIGPEGVKVEPVIDVTKVVIAFFTTFSAMMITLFRLKRFMQEQKLD